MFSKFIIDTVCIQKTWTIRITKISQLFYYNKCKRIILFVVCFKFRSTITKLVIVDYY